MQTGTFGSLSISDCQCLPGFYRESTEGQELDFQCVACLEGAICENQVALPLPGYYGFNNSKVEFYRCYLGEKSCQETTGRFVQMLIKALYVLSALTPIFISISIVKTVG
eukprot:Lithocolla_globosa_v1_NODE_413_length_4121_cov_46.123709.p4 type:complete len:110 gc:universal NODE_413_length_4121_cov_46.123709:2478-2149(-)